MTISLNGETFTTTAGDVLTLASELTPAPETLLIEHNGLALHRSEWAGTRIQDGDKLEILRVAAGG